MKYLILISLLIGSTAMAQTPYLDQQQAYIDNLNRQAQQQQQQAQQTDFNYERNHCRTIMVPDGYGNYRQQVVCN